MTIDAMRLMHRGRICICRPHLRDLKNSRVLTWHILRVVDDIDAARATLERFDQEGVTDAVAISTSDEVVIEGALAAKFFRIYLGIWLIEWP